MDDPVKPTLPAKRRYDVSRRREKASQNRRAIVSAARTLFLERGYAATAMSAIAQEAGVAIDTVYAVVGSKPAIFRHLVETALSGEEQAVPAEERDYVRAVRAEPDPRQKLALYAASVVAIQARLAPLFTVLRDAARNDPDLAALWSEISTRRARNMRLFVADVVEGGGLRAGVTIEEAADLIWATNASEFYVLLVGERGWAPKRFERWLADMWSRMLLPETSAPLPDPDA